ncbi:hypothetical protein C5N14_21445 [Micromonospora sp. MW-13]|uniref:hypothetical protein n=1 Tax=Micromonospora sp. MW-13 TaxID=2094022 RepID=UPI000E437A51|nr:hypothetical protein [Micromonospora sp. MW-13]RGC67024.1 hypothetical protein C5N14_21445 [Micromonospora sp. MW-13]
MRRTIHTLGRRWPTLLAIASTVLTLGGGDRAGQVTGLGETLLLLPLVYLVVARAGRRGISWPVLVACVLLIGGLRLVELPATAVVVPIALGALVWSAIAGHALRPGMIRIQALGMLAFGALALLGLAVDPDVGCYLVAAGWFFHGIWDFVHLKLDKVVSRSYAEWCGMFDVLIAVQLVVLA